jgi:ribosomal protein S18 acetylase RimI-like enzyme
MINRLKRLFSGNMEPITTAQTAWLARVQIRKMVEEDLPSLEWDGEYTHFRRVYQDAFDRYRRGLTVLWVAELPGTGVIGQVFIQLICDRPELADGAHRAYLYSFRVRPEFRNAGLGTRIMQVVFDDLRQRGFRNLTLNVAKDNPRARRLYERNHFHIVAHEAGRWTFQDEKGGWQTVEEPAWRMERRL